MIEEIIKHESSKIIYVITHYKEEDDEEEENELKKDFINRINTGIQEISKDSKNKEIINKYILASLDNTIFVDFHRTNYKEVGTKELFNTIGNFFINSEDYISSSQVLSEEQIEERAKILRERANDILLSNKIWGGIVGILPIIDYFIQKYFIKKNAAKKAGQIFGIDIKFIEDENEKKKKIKEEKKKEIEKITIPKINVIKRKYDSEIKECDELINYFLALIPKEEKEKEENIINNLKENKTDNLLEIKEKKENLNIGILGEVKKKKKGKKPKISRRLEFETGGLKLDINILLKIKKTGFEPPISINQIPELILKLRNLKDKYVKENVEVNNQNNDNKSEKEIELNNDEKEFEFNKSFNDDNHSENEKIIDIDKNENNENDKSYNDEDKKIEILNEKSENDNNENKEEEKEIEIETEKEIIEENKEENKEEKKEEKKKKKKVIIEEKKEEN